MGLLKPLQVEKAKPGTTLKDGDGLYLRAQPTIKSWVVRWTVSNHGSRGLTVIGSYPSMSLAKARAERDRIKSLAARGINPNLMDKQVKNDDANPEIKPQQDKLLFGYQVDRYIDSRRKGAKALSEKRISTMEYYRDKYLKAFFNMRCHDMRPQDLEVLVEPLLERGFSPFNEVLALIQQVLDCAYDQTGQGGANITTLIRSRANKLRPVPVRGRFLLTDQLPKFGSALGRYRGFSGATIVIWIMSSLCRSGEARLARRKDVDLQAGLWTIPAEHMKLRRPHVVPMSKQMIELAKLVMDVHSDLGPDDPLFPAVSKGKVRPLTHSTIAGTIKGVGFHDALTPHGMRYTSSTALNSMRIDVNGMKVRRFSGDAIERQLAHLSGDKVRAVYNHAEYLDERREMIQAWCDLLDESGISITKWVEAEKPRAPNRASSNIERLICDYAINHPKQSKYKAAKGLEDYNISVGLIQNVWMREGLSKAKDRAKAVWELVKAGEITPSDEQALALKKEGFID